MGAALGQPPPDSPGVKEVTDLVKDIGAQTANIAEAMTELSREVRDKSNAASSKQPAPSVQTPDPVQQAGGGTTLNQMPRGMPAVIDLSSRIPAARHSQPRNVTWATVTLSSGMHVTLLGPIFSPFPQYSCALPWQTISRVGQCIAPTSTSCHVPRLHVVVPMA